MKHTLFSAATVAVCSFTLLGLLAAQDQPAAPAPTKQMAKGMGKGMEKGMMKKGEAKAGEKPGEKSMMAEHEEMAKLVNQVTADLTALQNEPDIAAIKTKLSVDQATMEKLRDHMNQQQSKMKSMMGGMTEGMPGRMQEGKPANTAAPDKPATDHAAHQH